MESISVRIEHKSMDKAKFQKRHDTREGHIPKYVEQDKSHLNSVLIEPISPGQLKALCLDRRGLRDTERKMKSDASIASVGIITFSTSAQTIVDKLTVEAQDRLFAHVAAAIAKRVNNSLTGLVVHRDESAIHCHFQMPAYGLDGTPVSKLITPKFASELQDIAGACVAEYGISRGVKKSERIALGEPRSNTVHKSVKELHEDLPVEIENLKGQVRELELKLEKNTRLLLEKQIKIEALDKANTEKLEQAEKTLAAYQKRVTAAEFELENLRHSIEEKAYLKRSKIEPVRKTVAEIKTGMFSSEKFNVITVEDHDRIIDKIYADAAKREEIADNKIHAVNHKSLILDSRERVIAEKEKNVEFIRQEALLVLEKHEKALEEITPQQHRGMTR